MAVVFLALPGSAPAELYHYIDKEGVIRFTDNYLEIPEKERFRVEVITQAAETVFTEANVNDNSEGARKVDGDAERGFPENQTDPTELFKKIQKDLDRDYDALALERETLEKEQGKSHSPESARDFQERVRKFNQRLDEYERRRDDFKVQIDAYNRSLPK